MQEGGLEGGGRHELQPPPQWKASAVLRRRPAAPTWACLEATPACIVKHLPLGGGLLAVHAVCPASQPPQIQTTCHPASTHSVAAAGRGLCCDAVSDLGQKGRADHVERCRGKGPWQGIVVHPTEESGGEDVTEMRSDGGGRGCGGSEC